MWHFGLAAFLGAGLLLAAPGCGKAPLLAPAAAEPAPHPLRERLAGALATAPPGPHRALLGANLARLEGMTLPEGRHLLVDVAGQRLYMLNGETVEGSMAVVVGTPRHPTPLMSSRVTRLIARPYWHVPLDLAQQRVAPAVVRHGPRWLKARGMEVLDPAVDAAVPIAATAVDWKAVAARRAEARVRQKPGPQNMMGAMKFEMPNDLGIYLHDTPDRHLFAASDRAQSAGCIRVADWARLATWLWGGPLPDSGPAPEQAIDLPNPVPILIVYLTLSPLGPDGWRPVPQRQPDPYALDAGVAARPISLGLK